METGKPRKRDENYSKPTQWLAVGGWIEYGTNLGKSKKESSEMVSCYLEKKNNEFVYHLGWIWIQMKENQAFYSIFLIFG